MNIFLTHGYFLREDPKEQAIMKPYPPLGLLYLSAWLDLHGVENEVFDTTFSKKEDLKKFLLEHRPRIVALYVNLMTKLNVIEIMRFIRAQESLNDSLIVLGGPDVTHNAEDYLKCGADLIVIGEGEQTMLEIADWGFRISDFADFDSTIHNPRSAIHNPQSAIHNISGLAFLLPDGSVFKTAPREKIRDLDRLPFPNRRKINLQLYLDAWKRTHGHSAVSISTQRGCPYTCRWCSTAVYGQSYRRRSPVKVADEIEWLQKNYDFDLIWFVDDVFTVSHKWLGEFHDELKARDLKIKFECITRADRLNEEVIRVLKDCGCFRVWIGAESGSQRIIDAMDRRVEVGQVREMIKAARREGIQAGTFIMLGYPGETEADIRETVKHLKDSNPDLFTITVAYPIRGTGLYEEVQATSVASLLWAERSDRDIDFQRTYPRRYYDYAVRWTVNAVHWHKAKVAGKQFSFKGLKLLGKIGAAKAGMAWWRIAGELTSLRSGR
ncbi:MAG: Ribosomal protein S12 methylthiotransferase RimO [Saprospiraceae bacterium]|nr:Ribosomal protein S12 methylthiotransferase RimO [Saprospiraceae bacterium]